MVAGTRGPIMAARFLLALLLLFAMPASAADPAPDIQQFKPVPDFGGFVLVQDATLMPQLRAGVGLYLNYAVNPLEVSTPEYGRQFGVVDGLMGGDLVAAFGLFDWWELGIHFPFMQIPLDTPFLTSAALGGQDVPYGIGDIVLSTRLQALDPRTKPVGIAGHFFLSLPTGSTGAGLGRGLPGGGGRFIVSQRWNRVHFAANLGYSILPSATIANLTTDDEVTYSVGFGVSPITDILDIDVELDGSFTPGPNERDGVERFGDGPHSPLELLVGARVKLPHDLDLHAGVGKGITPGFGSPDFRVYAGLSWAIRRPIDRDKDGLPDPDDACKREPEDMDGFEDADGCPDPDNDADGFPDDNDECPNDPEDVDGFQDDDGCPEPDNDGDGLVDAMDSCPLEAEDADGFQDDDGCVDPDNDGDGIDDGFDACPDAAETVDGWADDDGCPDPDNDGDGLLDEEDLCPNEAEERNGVRDDDGCPDTMLAVRDKTQIRFWNGITFKTGSATIEDEALEVVQAVAAVLVADPGILSVRVEGHTSSKGSERSNQRLSEKRAKAVVAKLVELGVAEGRLTGEGLGETRPVASNRTDEGRAENRRIEIHVVDEAPAVIDSANPAGVPPVPDNPWGVQPAAPEPAPAANPWGTQPAAPAPAANPWGSAPAKEAPAVETTTNPWGAAPPKSDSVKKEEKEEKPKVESSSNPWGS
jgi:outer membrane protein OmpA-like peptidoglycan-associated protein